LTRVALIAAVALLAAVPAPAWALRGGLDDAATALRSDPVYVAPDAERKIDSGEAAKLRAAISREGAGPLYLAVLPARAANEAGGDASAALRKLALSVGEPGTYAAVIGSSFRAGATGGLLPRGEAARLAGEALDARRGQGTAAVLEDFVGRVGEARRSGTSGGGGGGGGFPWVLALLLGIPGVALLVGRSRRRRREREELAEVKQFARDDLVALGDDIRALDLDVEMPNADAEAKEHYSRAVDCYTSADEAWGRARRPEDLARVSSLLEEGRWAMTAAKARLEGKPAPERRVPCFFDPRHGPSVADVEWAPPGGAPRQVPVCAADLQRINDGLDPAARQVEVAGQQVPYWNAGPAYLPWAGGFFGGGLLPGLFIGSLLGGGFGGFGGGYADEAYASGGDSGDFGGGDSGDFGGDLSDIGGGDFGGGDFGGGGGDF
jgi:hypothetical protein